MEIVVYGDAPEGEGSTDTISIQRDLLDYYAPVGPTIIMPADPGGGGGGGGGDTNPCDEWGDVEEKATWIAVGFGVFAAGLGFTGAGAPAAVGVAIVGGAFGLGAFYAGRAADDPPQPDYKHVAGSTIPIRKLALTGTPSENRSVETLLAVERPTAVFVDAIECAQGAFLAGDASWTQRHTEAAGAAYLDCGKAFLGMADTLQGLGGQLQPAGPAPVGVRRRLPALLAKVRPALGLSPDDEARIIAQIRPLLSRGIPTQAEIRSAVETIRHLGRRLATPIMVNVRFAFVNTRPVGM